MQLVITPDLNEVTIANKTKGAAAPKQDYEECSKELCDEGGHKGSTASLFQVGCPENPLGPWVHLDPHSANCNMYHSSLKRLTQNAQDADKSPLY